MLASIGRMATSAKFLVLLDGAPRALLFDSEQRLVCEVIDDDGFIVETLLRTARPYALTDDTLLRRIVPAPSAGDTPRCYELR